LFTFLVGWHASAVSLHPVDAVLAQLACPLNDINFCLHLELLTYLFTNTDHYDLLVKYSWYNPSSLSDSCNSVQVYFLKTYANFIEGTTYTAFKPLL